MTHDPTVPGPECGKASRPIERRGLTGQCDGCYGWHPIGLHPIKGWIVRKHQPTDAQGHECPNCKHGTVYDPPVYCRFTAPQCDRCIADSPDGWDERGRPYWVGADGVPEYREQGVEA